MKALSLAAWMELALYDPAIGYYAAGRVQFGDQRDFWTWPERLSPTFGRVVAHALSRMCEHLVANGSLPEGEPFTVVELGAGDGTLARDVCDAAVGGAGGSPAMEALAARLVWRIGERSPALQAVQARTCAAHAGRVIHLPQGADDELAVCEPIVGVILSNELLDVWAHHRVRPLERTLLTLEAREEGEDWAAQDEGGLRTRAGAATLGALVVTPAWAPIAGHPDEVPLTRWLDALAPLVARRAAADPAPPELLVAPGMGRFAAWAASRLRAGWMLTIDYGGTPLHALDPHPSLPHLRVFPRPPGLDDRIWEGSDAIDELGWPGTQDITAEIDFGHLAWEGERVGLRAVHFGPQGHLCLPGGPDPMERGERARVEGELRRKYGFGAIEAAKMAWEAARGFRDRSPGFRLLLQQAADPAPPLALEWVSDPIGLADLPQLRPDVADAALEEALARAGLPLEVARVLRPAGCPIADLDDAGLRAHTTATLDVLRRAGLLGG